MDIKVLAIALLIGHVVSAFFMLLVLIRQTELFKVAVEPGLVGFRRILYVLAIGIFVGNIAPICVDLGTITGNITRSTDTVNAVGVIYSGSNAVIYMLSAILIWILYKMAAATVLIKQQNEQR